MWLQCAISVGRWSHDGPYICHDQFIYTLPKTNIAPENRPSQKETSIPTFSGAMLVSGRVEVMKLTYDSFECGGKSGVSVLLVESKKYLNKDIKQ